ncbi:MAG: ClpX C4-type zinc finger protein [Jatrophihabitans sp.]
MTALLQQVRCSFCTKPELEVSKIIAGPGIYICDECVAACNAILEDDRQSPATGQRLPDWQTMTEEEMLTRLPKIAAVSTQVEANLRDWVDRLRERGVTWARIGAALQMTRQSAWGRFSGEE